MAPRRQFDELIHEALCDAFDLQSLARMVRFKLGRDLEHYATGNKPHVVFKLIEAARREGFLDRLVISARESNPGNEKLAALRQSTRGGEDGVAFADGTKTPAGEVRHFSQSDLYQIRDLLADAGFAQNDRQDLLFVSMNQRYVSTLPAKGAPIVRLLKVLNALNQTPALTDGELPLRTLLINAVESSKPLPVSKKLAIFLDRLRMA